MFLVFFPKLLQALPRRSKYKHLERSPFYCAATVQLATPESCLVIHLARRSGKHSMACTPILKAVLCDEQFVKAGCAVDEDLMSLYSLWGGLDAKSRLDLGFLGGNKRAGTRFGLKTLSKGPLGVDLPKPVDIATSDWSAVPLTEAQIMYSARDAWAGAAIAEKLADYDPDRFSHKSLVSSLPQFETSIAALVEKQERRDQAKKELRRLIAQYSDRREMPHSIQAQVRDLRERINAPVMEPRLVFDVEHLSDW
jgi:ribonuclease D